VIHILFFTMLAMCASITRKNVTFTFVVVVGICAFVGFWLLVFLLNPRDKKDEEPRELDMEAEEAFCRGLIASLEHDKQRIKELVKRYPLEVVYPERRFVFRSEEDVDSMLFGLREQLSQFTKETNK